MDWLTFISTVVSALAWPTALVAMAILFRGKISSLLERVREVSGPGGTSAKFGDELERARIAAEQIPEALATDGPIERSDPTDPFLELTANYPAAAVLEAYQVVEKEMENLASRLGLAAGADVSRPWRSIGILKKASLSPVEMELFQRIRDTRNAAVHLARPITTGEALEFKELTDRFIAILRLKPDF